jgi:hypothetical protein
LNRRTTSAWALLVALWVVLFAFLKWFPVLPFETYVAAGVATAFTSIVYGVLLLRAKDGAPVALEKDLASKSPDAFRGLNRLAGLLFLLLGAAILFATFEQYAWVWVAIVGSGISFSVVTYLRLKYERDEGHNEQNGQSTAAGGLN